MMEREIPYKANRVLNLFLIGLLLILTRVWYLGIIQHEEKLQEARRPQRRAVIERVDRATIRDRYNLPLATNQIRYQAAVSYAQIREIPTLVWKRDEKGRAYRHYERLAYVRSLAACLAKELGIEAQEIEQVIHGRAALFPHTPFVIKDNLSEREYYRLRMLERDWQGISTQRVSKRVYPQGKTAADIIGYMGAINEREHGKVAQEIQRLQEYIAQRERGEAVFLPKGYLSPLAVRKRLKELQERAYTINDLVGKTGLEGSYDEQLRGFSGKKTYEVDVRGSFLRELPGTRNPIPGERMILTLSSELQAYAEMLLAHHEERKKNASPWIKGGAIVALDPHTGEILALASHPRFDPSDFAERKGDRIHQWIESDSYLGEIWDGKRPMERELYSFKERGYYTEERWLTWERYLDSILPAASPVKQLLASLPDIRSVYYFLQSATDSRSLDLLDPIPLEEDKLLAVDLCRLLLREEDFSEQLLDAVGDQSISSFRRHAQALHAIQETVREQVRALFKQIDFEAWREAHFAEFMRIKRREEKERKTYARPYTEYLDGQFRALFHAFWQEHRWDLLQGAILGKSPPKAAGRTIPYFAKMKGDRSPALEELKTVLEELGPLAQEYLKAMRSFHTLDRPLLGSYPSLRRANGVSLEKHLASAFYPHGGFGYGRSQTYRQATPQGSVFKLVTAYEALRQRYESDASLPLNPLTVIDEAAAGGKILGYRENGEPIPRLYKGGKLPRGHRGVGRADMVEAIAQSSNLYFSLLARDVLEHPDDLADAARRFGFGEKTGIALPGEISGQVPKDLHYNTTGLYAFAIGQHSLVVTPLQTALMLASLANEGKLLKPKVVRLVAGKRPSESSPFSATSFPYQESLDLVGIDFPLFTEMEKNREQPRVDVTPTEVRRQLPLPPAIQEMLFEGMAQAVSGSKGSARPALMRALFDDPHFYRDYLSLHKQLAGKTGTAEILYKGTIDKETPAKIRNHVWFGGVAFGEESKEPELVIVVYLRFARGGKEAAPLAAQMVKKWREIRALHAR